MTLADRLAGRENNALVLRFALASLVVFSHSFPLSGRPLDEPLALLTHWNTFGGAAVDAFFVLSGLLITKSWADEPRLAAFLLKRFLRLVPALAVLTLLTVAVVGPLATTLPVREYAANPMTAHYLRNVRLFPLNHFLPGVFADLPHPHFVNGSLWTLPVEALCYGAVALLGLVGALRFRGAPAVLMALLWAYEWHVLPRPGVAASVWMIVGHANFTNCYHHFLAGMLLYQCRAAVPISAGAAATAALLAAVSCRTPHAHVVMRVAFPYLVCWAAFAPAGRLARFGRGADLSYGVYLYGFPVQQMVVHYSSGAIGWLKLFLIAQAATTALAYLSWRFVEAPALRLKRYIPRKAQGRPPLGLFLRKITAPSSKTP